MKRDDGFTLLEVLVAMLIGTIGLLGTIAVQQSIISASKNANDAAVAMRLASQKIEELYSRSSDTQVADQLNGLGVISTYAGDVPIWYPKDASGQQIPEHVDAEGQYLRDGGGYAILPQPGELGRYRWRRQWKVVDTGVGLPYVISVIVSYTNDVGEIKTTRLDLERRKSW
ncbi:MAG: prepilin-type N-terminal cleavage/methylation domain-containing protein [Deltaproteobacteria bacterium]|nr:prepilin-type N-terminal cleavage/methylation domain-containing protein [Deltaproteobacteria bacterium]